MYKDFIKRLRDKAVAFENNEYPMEVIVQDYRDCAKLIEYLSGQPQADKWIPCEERLPSDRDWYLAVFQEADTGFQLVPMIAEYIGSITKGTTEEGWSIAHCTDEDYAPEYYKKLKCVAWTKLPQPYKKEGAE